MLVIKRADNGEWALPGGIVEIDGDPREAARREILEETGVQVDAGQLTGVYKNMRLAVVSLVFWRRPVQGAGDPTEEAAEVAWLSGEEVVERMPAAFASRLTDAADLVRPLAGAAVTVA
jgi:8-oxo-dGTP diphosphatase